MNSLELFLQTLAKPRNSGVMKNPYRQPELLDNLRCYLQAMMEWSDKRVLLVGEALGFKGGKLTGIPFSSGAIYQRFDHPLLQQLGPQLNIETVESENTATIVWDYLSRSGYTPLFWNAYPFHPHPKGLPQKNRAPSAEEVRKGRRYLKLLAEIFEPEIIAGVGGKGVLCARQAFPDRHIAAIRHPSYGGKADFITGMEALFSEAESAL